MLKSWLWIFSASIHSWVTRGIEEVGLNQEAAAIVVPIMWYFAIYARVRLRGPEYPARTAARQMHAGVVCWGILIFLSYCVIPRMDTAESWQGFITLYFGSMILLAAVGTRLIRKFERIEFRQYQDFFFRSQLASGMGLFYWGAFWVLGNGRSPIVIWILFAGGLLNLIALELTFLQRNGWKLLPNESK